MRHSLIARTVTAARAKGPVVCHADVFAWGLTPPEGDGGVSKAELSRMKARFYNTGQRRCTLCDEYIDASFTAHCGYVGHIARLGILERVTAILQKETSDAMASSAYDPTRPSSSAQQKVRCLLENWWKRLNEVDQETMMDYKRIASLSAPVAKKRLWRVRFLLEFLRDRGVIRDCLTSSKGSFAAERSFVRTKRFERSEMIGDNIVKVVVPDRLMRLFPATEGGVTYKVACIQQLLDSNGGLLQIYDYIDLNSIIGVRLPNNKTKSDVVESIFGELQTFIWASEVTWGLNQYPAIPTAEHRYVRALVEHLLNELTHMILMWRIETTLENAKDYLEEQIQRKPPQQQYQSSLRGGAMGGAMVVKEVECDRGRYAVLPLLMSFPYVGSSIESRNPERPSSMAPGVHHVMERGTPHMLFQTPVPEPRSMALHYRPRLRVVRSTSEYRLGAMKALSMQRDAFITSTLPVSLSSSSSSSISTTALSNKMRGDKYERQQKQQRGHHPQPLMELAEEKYPTWSRDTRLADLRRNVESYMRGQGVYVETIGWESMLTTLAQNFVDSHNVNTPKLQSEPTKAPRLSSSEVPFSSRKLMFTEGMCIPPLES